MYQILVIEDDPLFRLVLTKSLKNQGYDVMVAANGEEGLQQARELRPALILCDWMMPRMDGLEVCRHIKADPELATTFFVLLTAREGVSDRVEGLDTGADDFLSKPVEMNELRAKVRAGLRLHQLNQDLQTAKKIMEAELAEAAEYVRSLLPSPLTGKVTIDARFIPSRQLGGDCFDYYWLNSDELAIYVVDAAGHGVGSALLSVSVLNVLRSQSLNGVNFSEPDRVLTALNDKFPMDQTDKYFTIWYGVYNQSARQLVYASAGHPPAILLSPNQTPDLQVQSLKTPGMPVGMFPEAEYVCYQCPIVANSTLYVFSDGAYEICQPDGSIWSLDAFTNLLASQPQTDSNNLDRVLNQIKSLSAKEALDDDLSLLQINFEGV
ncbi:MAG: PP2C family protein-serine/threonine phosphatase [Hormoscilla sp.]